MCDYSLMEYRARLASNGEQLEVYRFASGAKGLITASDALAGPRGLWNILKSWWCGVGDRSVVCIPPGARLRLYGIPTALQARLGLEEQEEATFTQLHADAGMFRDAIRFDGGGILSFQDLEVGQRVEVLTSSLPDDAADAAPADAVTVR